MREKALTKLRSISDDFKSRLLPLCQQFLETLFSEANIEQLIGEHKTLSVAVVQQVIVQLGSVEDGGWSDVRSKRRAIYKEAQEVLHEMEIKLQSQIDIKIQSLQVKE